MERLRLLHERDTVAARMQHEHELELLGLKRERDDEQARARKAADRLSEAHEAALDALREELDTVKIELQTATEAAKSAIVQRDLARGGFRRAAVSAENGWRARVEELERQLRALQHAERERERLHGETAREMEAWRDRYHGLRRRLDVALQRSGVLPATRVLLPRPVRQWALTLIRRRTER